MLLQVVEEAGTGDEVMPLATSLDSTGIGWPLLPAVRHSLLRNQQLFRWVGLATFETINQEPEAVPVWLLPAVPLEV